MRTSILKYAAPITLSVLLCSTAYAAAAKPGCLLFCGDGKPSAESPKAAAPAMPNAPANLEAAIAQAQVARKKGNIAEAAGILSQLVLFAPDDARVLGEYGKTLAALGKSEDALAFLERAIQLAPADWSLYSAQGVAYDQKGNYESAQLSYSRALSLKPDEPTVLNNAALSHMQLGDLDGAEALLQQASPGSAEFARISQNLALVQKLKADHRKASASRKVPALAEVATASPPPAVAPPSVPAVPAPDPVASTFPAQTAIEPVALAAPPAKASGAPVQLSGIEALKADPTVRMAPVPKDEPAPKVVAVAKPVGSKPAALPKPQTAEIAPSPAPKLAADTPAQQPSSPMTYYVQAGAFPTEERADKAAHELDNMGARVSPATIDGHAVYRVRIGPFRDMRQANTAIDQAHSMGRGDLKIVSE